MRALLVSLLSGLLIATIAAQDSRPPFPTGIGSISGVDRRPATGVPVNAYSAAQIGSTAPGRNVNRYSPVREGQFTLIDLPPGSYVIEAGGTFHPATRDRAGARVVTVGPGQQVDGVDIQVQSAPPTPPRPPTGPAGLGPPVIPTSPGARGMAPGGLGAGPAGTPPAARNGSSISGVVLDASNQPVPGAEVRALTSLARNGIAQLVSSGAPATTDADGRYHLLNRLPGTYGVAAIAYGSAAGSGVTTVARLAPATTSADGTRTTYVTTYFPSASRPVNARMITLAEHEDRVGVDIHLQRAQAIDLTGRIQSNFGGPGPYVSLAPSDVADQVGGLNVRRTAPDPDARFKFIDVPLGRYVLTMNGPGGSARVEVDVTNTTAVREVVLTPSGRVTVRGSVQLEGIAASAAELTQIRVRLDPEVLEIGAVSTLSNVSAAGTFSLPVSPGRYRLHAQAPTAWTQVSGRLNDLESLDAAVDIASDVTGALIVLAAQPTELMGVVRNAQGQMTTATVVVFPADQGATSDLDRRLHVIRAENGGFTLSGLPPGKYWAAVGDADMVPGHSIDPVRLGRLVNRGVAFELRAGEHRSVQILWER